MLLANTNFLNAEDHTTVDVIERCVDLALMDPEVEVGVLRGGVLRGTVLDHPHYRGRRVFSARLNLTYLYQGRSPLMFLHRPGNGPGGQDVLDSFAISGGCQLLLVMDYVLAEQNAYLTLPARKEGIIPGLAKLRLPRLLGERLARQAILFDREIQVDSPEGRLLCDEVAPPEEMDAAVERAIPAIVGSGVVSMGNRKALRVAQEPLERFQAYLALYAREMAECLFSPALVRNLEQYWTERRG